MMDKERLDNPIAGRIQSFYWLAKEFDDVDSKEINPSLHELKNIKQRYRSSELIAKGGMKRIYRVFDLHAKRYLAMAKLREDAPEELCDPFIREVWLTAQLMHPNIMTIHEIGIDYSGWPYFTMDLKEGSSLRELIEAIRQGNRDAIRDYPLEALLRLFLKVCDAIAYAHSVGVLHLDLKPANIQVGEYGQVLVCDWGMGKVFGSKSKGLELERQLLNPDLLGSFTLYGEIRGTPGNMAPEQVKKNSQYDVRTDIYGLGSILYALLTLRPPLEGEPNEILEKTLNGSLVNPAQRAPDRNIPKALDAVVMQAMAVNPAKRYKTVVHLQKEISRFLAGYATEAEDASAVKQFMLFYRRNKMLCNMTLGSLLFLIVGGGWAFNNVNQERQHAEKALQLYQSGQVQLDKVSVESIDSIRSLSKRLREAGDTTRSLDIMKNALTIYPDNPILLREIGIHFFVLQHFKQALTWFEKGDQYSDEVVQLTKKYAEIKSDSRRLLLPDKFIELMRDLKNHDKLRSIIVLEDQRLRIKLEDRSKILEAYLKLLNPSWQNGWFIYDKEKRSLKVGGKGFVNITSALVGLHLRELDIRHSDVSNMSKMRELAIERLDIRDTKVEKIWSINRMSNLQELIIDQGQFHERQLSKIPVWVNIIEMRSGQISSQTEVK